MAGLPARLPIDLLGRDRVHADLARDRRDGDALAPRRAERLRIALHVPRRTGVVARSDRRLGGGEADRRARDDGDDLSRLRPRPLRRLPSLGGGGGGRSSRGTTARVRAIPARGAAGLSLLDDRSLGDHRRGRPADAAPARPRRGALPRRPVRPRRARGAAGGLRRGALRAPLADRSLHALALGVGASATGSAPRCSSSAP